MLLPLTRGDDVVAIVSCATEAQRHCHCCCLHQGTATNRRYSRRCHLLWRGDTLLLLSPTCGDSVVAAVSCGVATLSCWCRRRGATLPLLLSPLRCGNPPSLLLSTLPYPVAWWPSVAATTDTQQRVTLRRCVRYKYEGCVKTLIRKYSMFRKLKRIL